MKTWNTNILYSIHIPSRHTCTDICKCLPTFFSSQQTSKVLISTSVIVDISFQGTQDVKAHRIGIKLSIFSTRQEIFQNYFTTHHWMRVKLALVWHRNIIITQCLCHNLKVQILKVLYDGTSRMLSREDSDKPPQNLEFQSAYDSSLR